MVLHKRNFLSVINENKYLFIISIFSVPLCILFHELGHFLTGKLFGFYDTTIHFSYVRYAPFSLQMTSLHKTIFPIAGPVASVILAITGVIIYIKRKNRQNIIGYLSGSVALFSQTQILRFFAEGDRSEEFRFAQNLGIPSFIPVVISFITLFVSWFFVIRLMKNENRLLQIIFYIIGFVIGFMLWMNVIGPILMK